MRTRTGKKWGEVHERRPKIARLITKEQRVTIENEKATGKGIADSFHIMVG
jgi:hypothetical protein